MDFLSFINSSFEKTSESLDDLAAVGLPSLSERRPTGDRNGAGLARDKRARRARRASSAYSSPHGKKFDQNSIV